MADDVYIRILEDLAHGLGGDRVNLWVSGRPVPYTYYFELKPKNPKSAPISGTIEQEGDIEITIGSVSTELQSKKRDYNDPNHLERFQQICAAVIAGKYEEFVYSIDNIKLGVVGKVGLPDKELRFKTIDRLSLRWLSKGKRVVRIEFEPY